jgi:FlaG/FlaF family flagellin (archaellin)
VTDVAVAVTLTSALVCAVQALFVVLAPGYKEDISKPEPECSVQVVSKCMALTRIEAVVWIWAGTL